MKLTLTREQIPLARETVAVLRNPGPGAVDVPDLPRGAVTLPGHSKWWGDAMSKTVDHAYADALEAAITEAEHPMQVITLAKQGDADERAFWREVFMAHVGGTDADGAVEAADVALAGYRAAFCTGMPSDQKGAK